MLCLKRAASLFDLRSAGIAVCSARMFALASNQSLSPSGAPRCLRGDRAVGTRCGVTARFGEREAWGGSRLRGEGRTRGSGTWNADMDP